MVPHQAGMATEETAGPPGLKTLHLPIEEEEEPAMPMQEVLCKGSDIPCAVDSFNTHSLRKENPFCRICHEGEGAEALLSPCNCAGTLAAVHQGCLECWLATSNTNCCELCHFQFAVERLPKPLSEWLETPSAQHQRRTLCGDAMCFSFITPLASLSGWLCIQGAMDLHYSNSLEAIGLIVLTFTLFSIYLFWTTVSLRYHLHLFKAWRRTNQRVMLLVHRPKVLPCSRRILSQHLSNTDTDKETMV